MISNDYSNVEKAFLVTDVGTSNLKTSLIDIYGKVIETTSVEYPTLHDNKFYAEQNPEDWWNAYVDTVKNIFHLTKISPKSINAISISGHTPSVLPVDKNGKALRNAIIWMDRRSETECKWLNDNRGVVDVEKITKNKIDPTYSLSKIIWLKNNENDIFHATQKYMQTNGYIIHKLTDCFSIDITQCSLTQLYDMDKENWSTDICGLIELDTHKLPKIYKCYEIVGAITGKSSKITGLKQGTPVLAGCNDSAASSLGVGIIKAGSCFLVMGQAGGVGFCTNKIPSDSTFLNYNYFLPDTWFNLAPMASFAASFRWAKENLYDFDNIKNVKDKDDPYEKMNHLINKHGDKPSGIIFLPYMAGERSPLWDSYARGVFFGLHLSTTTSDLLRSIMEGTGFSVLHNIEIMEKAGVNVEKLTCTGGGSKSKIWNQIISDITNKEIVTTKVEESVLLGNAIVAGYGIGVYNDKNIYSNVDAMVSIGEVFHPNIENYKIYSKLFPIYKNVYTRLKDEFYNLFKAFT
jgi:xylulokinase